MLESTKGAPVVRQSSSLLFVSCLFLAGCSTAPVFNSSSTPAGSTQGVTIAGRVHGGQGPISGAQIYLYGVSETGYAGPGIPAGPTNMSTSLLNAPGYVTTAMDGSFTITGDYSCNAAAPNVYAVAVGGTPEGQTSANSSIILVAGLGPCTSLQSTTFLTINEVSTVASVYAGASFATDPTHVSSAATPLAIRGVEDALASIYNLEDPTAGIANTTTEGTNGIVPQAEINTLANILAACVNSDGSVTGPTNPSPCYTLFYNAENNGTPAPDTATAMLNIAHNPGANVQNLFNLQGSSPPFLPDLPMAPNDFTIAIDFTGYTGGATGCTLDAPKGIAVSAKNDIWVANYGGSSICEFNILGAPEQAAAITGNGLSEPQDIAIDGNGYVWVASASPSALSSFTSTGTAVTTTTSGSLSYPRNLAIDGSNNIWAINYTGSSLSEFSSSSGTPSAVTGDPFGTSVLSAPFGVAIDVNGNAWVANDVFGGQIVEFTGSSPTTFSTHSGGGLAGPEFVAFDPSGNLWVTDYSNPGALSEFNSSGAAISTTAYSGGGLDDPDGIAIDSNGNVWVANVYGNTISEFNSSGTAISPSAGYGLNSAGLAGPFYLAIDGSGNIWVANNGTATITEFIGIAAPVVTPKVANLQSPYSANNSAVNRP